VRILVTTAHPQALKHQGDHFGRLLVPEHHPRAKDTAEAGIPWAADNGCYQGLNERLYRRMLRTIESLPGCLFVTVPDIVGDARATLRLFREWHEEVALSRQPLALVAQDGLAATDVPWGEIDALFVGGSTDFKEGARAASLVAQAKERGLHVHMGRVNGRRRFNYARLIGCDTVDGTGFSMFRDTWLPVAMDEWAQEPLRHHQHRLPLEEGA
jgi:hypothetical protein